VPAERARPARRVTRSSVILTLILLVAGCAGVRPVDPSLAGRLGELLLVGFRGTEVGGNAEVFHLVCNLKVGGLILFEREVAAQAPRNIASLEQLARLTRDLQALARRCAGRPLLIAVDAEGGAVMRLSPRAGFSPTLGHGELGELGDLALTELEARRIGTMLRETGIGWNLAPVVDLALNPFNTVVGEAGRAFSATPERVTAHARAYLQGMRAAGILTTLKHFPGHGSSWEDSHLGFVDVTDTARPDLELAPYRALIREGLVDSVMTAHVFNRRLDRRHPATLSRPTIHGLLRGELEFGGVVVTDDLQMGAIGQHYGLDSAAVLALNAGVDVLLIANNTTARVETAADRVLAAIQNALAAGTLQPSPVEAALARIRLFRARLNLP
jgi:beta-N-acetylhexosaminidase